MKILSFDLDTELLSNNLLNLSDVIRGAIYQANSALIDKLNYGNDFIFLEPALFCYFLSDIDKNNLTQLNHCLLGYIQEADCPDEMTLKADLFGYVNLPNLGYLRAQPFEAFTIETTKIANKLIPNSFLSDSSIRLCFHPTDHLAHAKGITFHESPEQTLKTNQAALEHATSFFQNQLPEFWRAIETVTREFVLFNSPPEHHSFAGIMHHGTAYFNTEGKQQSSVFFIEDIAHQCGHILFNVLTLQTADFLRVPKNTPLKNFVPNDWETRDVYGAFHGLFTYTTILHALDAVVRFGKAEDKTEALGRMGFYLLKFRIDLQNLDNPALFTELGMDYYRQFLRGYQTVQDQYAEVLTGLSYSNQPYTYQHDHFLATNSTFALSLV